jgi:hypothetical protein
MIMIMTETVLNPDSEGGKQLAIVEGLAGNSGLKLQYCVLGGELKIEIQFGLAGRENLENPDAPINLIHQRIVLAILKIIERILKETTMQIPNAPFTRNVAIPKKSIGIGI